ncbi:hypothetical protein T7987_07885 [Sulfitobacter faviae]|uniref:Uncharacterized protein n=1 Tax=Sulfitobacter faviae TaxID=1775881 RepID=A0ABZ0V6V2_9RHOB|nr:hypothetical protein [Sulfitobacter faviae]WPZ23140.1 hypothetical protein T7987_07885 [Sulfitobacter faviae]
MTQIVSGNPAIKTQCAQPGRGQVRLIDRRNGQYLHLSGAGRTEGTAHAWIGTTVQAAALEAAARAEGQPWPFEPIDLREARIKSHANQN